MAAVIITISILHIFTLIQSGEAASVSSVYSPSNNQNFFTDIFSGILYRLFPRNVQSSSDQLDPTELRFLIQKRKLKQRLHNKFKKDILSMIAIKRRKDKEDDLIKYKYDKPPKINYQRNGSKSEALKNLFNIAGMSYSNSGSLEVEQDQEQEEEQEQEQEQHQPPLLGLWSPVSPV